MKRISMHKVIMIGLAVVLGGCTFVAISNQGVGAPFDYSVITKKYIELETAEDRAFDRLRFEMSPRQITKAVNFKFTVRDQLGRDWLFKTTLKNRAEDGAIAVYRWYKFFGLATPEIHYKSFTVNGQTINGIIQRIIENKGTLNVEDVPNLSNSAVEYMAQNHLAGWLLANYHTHRHQFLVMDDELPGKIRVERIDNSIEWFELGHDKLEYDYESPYFAKVFPGKPVGYTYFWNAHLNGSIKVPFQEIYNWADFVHGFPDDFYLRPFRELEATNFEMASNNGHEMAVLIRIVPEWASADPKTVIPLFLKRKHEVMNDLSAFFDSLSQKNGASIRFQKNQAGNESRHQIGKRIALFLDSKIQARENDINELSKIPNRPQSPFFMQSSFPAYKILRKLLTIRSHSPELQARTVQGVIRNLKALLKRTTIPLEKVAIENAIENVKCFSTKRQAGVDLSTVDVRVEFDQVNRFFQKQTGPRRFCINLKSGH